MRRRKGFVVFRLKDDEYDDANNTASILCFVSVNRHDGCTAHSEEACIRSTCKAKGCTLRTTLVIPIRYVRL